MGRVINQDQNNAKALEIRLEQNGAEAFNVIIAGMTFNLRTGCASGICEPTGEDEFMSIENETYKSYSFGSYREAKNAYEQLKKQYL